MTTPRDWDEDGHGDERKKSISDFTALGEKTTTLLLPSDSR